MSELQYKLTFYKNKKATKELIHNQTNTQPANATITMLSNNLQETANVTIKMLSKSLYTAKQIYDLQISQSTQCYQIVDMQPKKHTSGKCHNHNVTKQFICSQTNTLLATVTITMLSNSLYAAKQTHESQWYHNTYISQTKAWPSNGRRSKLQNYIEW